MRATASGLLSGFLFALVTGRSSSALAQGAAVRVDEADRKSYAAARVAVPPRIDGRLDDPAWALAAPDDRFLQRLPDEGHAASERTELRIVYDDEAVYVAVRCADRDPVGVVARMTRRDRDVQTDAVTVTIDGRHDHASAAWFRLSAAGVQSDGLHFDDVQGSSDWDAVWHGRVSRDAGGWSAEMRIPLRAIRFSPTTEGGVWGLQVQRTITRHQEVAQWQLIPMAARGHVSMFGHLEGLTGLRPRSAWEARPFVLGRVRGHSDEGRGVLGGAPGGETGVEGDAGLDVKGRLGRDLTLDASINPDFGDVEADEVVLNLTRFETFFPEKRPFFTEGVDVFATPMRLFYSRRIGQPPVAVADGDTVRTPTGTTGTATENVRPLRIVAATKITGQVGRNFGIGALTAVTAPETVHATDAAGETRRLRLAPLRGHVVARGRWSPGGASYLGGTVTAQSRLGGDVATAAADHDSYVQSLDGQWQSPAGRVRVGGQLALSERVGGPSRQTRAGAACPAATPGACVPIARSDGTSMLPGSRGAGAQVSGGYLGDHLVADASYFAYAPRFYVDDLGFITEFNRQQGNVGVAYRETRPGRRLRTFQVRADANTEWSFDGVMGRLGNGVTFSGLTLGYWTVTASTRVSYPVQWNIYETGDGARFERPNGHSYSLRVGTDGRAPVVVGAGGGGYYDFYGGAWSTDASVDLMVQALSRLELTLTPRWSWTGHNARFYACADAANAACTSESVERRYTVAQLDSGSASLTLRGMYAFSRVLTLQAFGQAFAAQGRYSRYRELQTTGTRPYIHLADLVPSGFGGDSDGDGRKDDDFLSVALNMNLMLRWEPQPGTVFTLVYSRAQTALPSAVGGRPTFETSGLGQGPTDDVLLLKLGMYLS